MAKEKIKISTIFFLLGAFFLLAFIVSFSVKMAVIDVSVGTDGSDLSVSGISDNTAMVLGIITIVCFLVGFMFKVYMENKYDKTKK